LSTSANEEGYVVARAGGGEDDSEVGFVKGKGCPLREVGVWVFDRDAK
jgi:hypothetical protein